MGVACPLKFVSAVEYNVVSTQFIVGVRLGEKEVGTGIVINSKGVNYLYGVVSIKPLEKPPFIVVTNLTKHFSWARKALASLIPISRR